MRIDVRARFTLVRSERRIDGDAQQVVARRNGVLAVATVEHKILTTEEKAIGVGPTVADALIAGDADGAAAEVVVRSGGLAHPGRIRIRVQHAETALRRSPRL